MQRINGVTKMFIGSLVLMLMGLTGLSLNVSAAPIMIDFENLAAGPIGAPAVVVVNNQYADLGITFNNPVALDYSLGAVAIPGFAHSGTKAIEQCYSIEFCTKPIEMSFTVGQTRVKVWVGFSGFFGERTESRTVVLRAFDAGGGEVDRATTTFLIGSEPIPIRTPLEVTSVDANITRVVVQLLLQDGNAAHTNSLAVDDVEFDTAISPVRSKLTFTTDRDGNREVYVMGADGSAPTNLTNNSAGNDSLPVWSPGSTKLAFATDRDGNAEVYVMNADGSAQTNLTNNPAFDSEPAWSSDGTKLAFENQSDGNREIFVMNTDGGALTNITDNGAFDADPAWSPDGTKLAFATDRDGNFEVYVMNADGSTLTNLTNNSGFDGHPAWSPDGTKLAFESERDGNREIYVMNADGSTLTNLTNNSGFDGHPAWSPDGTKLAFATDRDGNFEVYAMNADGSAQTNLTNNTAFDSEPDWQPLPRLIAAQVSQLVFIPGQVSAPIFISGDRSHEVEIFNGNFTLENEGFGKLIRTIPGNKAKFNLGNGFAVGNVFGNGLDEILIAHQSDHNVDVFNQFDDKIGTIPPNIADFQPGNGFAAGDVDGDGRDEILIAGDHSHRVDVFFITDKVAEPKVAIIPGAITKFNLGNGFAAGDVDGDGRDEILIAHQGDHNVDVFFITDIVAQPKVATIPGNRADFQPGNAIAAGDVDGDGRDEILIAGDHSHRVDVFFITDKVAEAVRITIPGAIAKFDLFDGFAAGDVDGNGTDEILIANLADGRINILKVDDFFSKGAPIATFSFDVNFNDFDGFAVGGNFRAVDSQTGENYSRTTANTPICVTSGTKTRRDISIQTWQKIVQHQLGVEGWNPEHHFVDTFPAEKDTIGPGAINNWFPLDAFKQTLCGTLDHFNFYVPDGGGELAGAREEMDWNNFFIPEGPFAYLLEQPKAQFLNRKCFFLSGDGWHSCPPGIYNCMEAEITPDESYFENVLNSKMTGSSILEGRQLCTYGPWVRECVHLSRPEIHPSELYWWVEQDPSGFFRFFLMQLQDDSNRYDRRDDYADGDGDPPVTFRPWTEPPLAAEFRIAFELDPATEPLNFDIFQQDARNVVTNQDPSFREDADDGTQHAIEYNGKVVLTVTERQPNDDDIGVGFLGLCRNAENTRLQGYITIRSRIGVNDRGGEGIHTIRVETNKLPYFSSTLATTPPVIDRGKTIKKRPTLFARATKGSMHRSLSLLQDRSVQAQQASTESFQLVANLQVQVSGDEVDLADRTISRVELVSEDGVRGLTFEPDLAGQGVVVKDVPVSKSVTLRFIMESSAVETVPVNGFTLAPLAQEEPMSSESADSSVWPELARIAGSLQETVEPPADIEHVQKWQLDIAPFYAPFRDGKVSPGEESLFAEEINEAVFENQVDRLQELFGTSQPFEITWSFRATNLSTNTHVPVVVNVSAAPTEVQVQLLHDKFPNGGIEFTFPAQLADDICELEATAEITDTNGFTNSIRRRFWSHTLSGETQQLEDNILPAVAELASESPDDFMSASTSDISGSPLDMVDISDDIIGKFRAARIVKLTKIDATQHEHISIDELRHLIRGARMFEPDDSPCLGVPATMVGTDGPDRLIGTAADDVIIGLGGDDVIMGQGGDDIICGGSGSDVILGGTGEDIIDGSSDSDIIQGGEDNDTIQGIDGIEEVEIVNGKVSFNSIKSTSQTTTDTTGCTLDETIEDTFVGQFSFDARLRNTSNSLLTNLVIEVTELTNGNLLQNADSGPGGVGAILMVPKKDTFSDGTLSPGECMDVHFIICLKDEKPFTFLVDVLGSAEEGETDSLQDAEPQSTRTEPSRIKFRKGSRIHGKGFFGRFRPRISKD